MTLDGGSASRPAQLEEAWRGAFRTCWNASASLYRKCPCGGEWSHDGPDRFVRSVRRARGGGSAGDGDPARAIALEKAVPRRHSAKVGLRAACSLLSRWRSRPSGRSTKIITKYDTEAVTSKPLITDSMRH